MQVEKEKNTHQNRYCCYYKAHIVREQAWFFVAIMRSYEHIAFDRTLDKQESVFEFFVPSDSTSTFLRVMNKLMQQGIVKEMHQEENRLLHSNLV